MLKIDYDSNNYLPTVTYNNAVINSPSINLCITDGTNQNLYPAAKRLLEWHFQSGHQNLCYTQIIILSPPFRTYKFLSSSHIPLEQHPKCEVCHYAKAKRKSLHGNKTYIYVAHEGSLRDNHLRPVSSVSVDNFES